MPYHALIDIESKALLMLSRHPSIILFLKDCIPGSTYVISVNSPNYLTSSYFYSEPFFLARKKPKEYPKWAWNRMKRTFGPTSPVALSKDVIARSALAVAKGRIISNIMQMLSSSRHPMKRGVDLQETVYMTKKNQAQRFKDAGYDESMLMEIPYVLQYADFAGLALREAADEILLKAKFDDEILAKTELLRLKFFKKIKDATSEAELPEIRDEFMRDAFVTATL